MPGCETTQVLDAGPCTRRIGIEAARMPVTRLPDLPDICYVVDDMYCDRDVDAVASVIERLDANALVRIDPALRRIDIAASRVEPREFSAAIAGIGYAVTRQWPRELMYFLADPWFSSPSVNFQEPAVEHNAIAESSHR
jgi:copper chaperone CopZ